MTDFVFTAILLKITRLCSLPNLQNLIYYDSSYGFQLNVLAKQREEDFVSTFRLSGCNFEFLLTL